MGKKLLITEKPSVAMEFAKALKINTNRKNGYLESENWIITWCVGHLVTMSYPEKYDEKLKFWRLDTLPFIPTTWKYEIIPAVENQFNIVKSLLQREDVEEIYNAGDSGREGEYIQRLVFMMAKPNPNAKMKRVWIDSQTEEEILRGIKEAKDLSEYDSLSDSAYLRAKEDYLIGINFSRLLSIIYGRNLANKINEDKASISVGRVMTCVLGMIVSREREIRNFVKTKYYKIIGESSKKLLYMQMPVSANTGSLILPPSRRPFIDLKRRMPLISFPLTRTSKLVSMKIFKSISQNYSNKQPQDHLTNFQAFSLVVSKSRQTFGDEPVCRDSDYHRLKAWILFYLTILTSSPFRSSLRIFFSTSLRAIIT